MKKLPLVYLAGPYTHPDPAENVRRTVLLAEQLAESGVMVPYVPHLTHLWHLIAPRPIEFWYAYDLHILQRCDAVLRLEGASEGADNEVVEAFRLGLPVFDDVLRLANWALFDYAPPQPTSPRSGTPFEGQSATPPSEGESGRLPSREQP